MALYDNPPYYFSAYGLAVKHGFKGSEEEWLAYLKGKSAYELAVEQGFTGTLQDWLNSLVGPPGPPGSNGTGAGDMLTAVYDPGGRRQDIFAYVDDLCGAICSVIAAIF